MTRILHIVSYLRTLTQEADLSLKLSRCCLNFFIKINFSKDIVVAPAVRSKSFLLLFVMGVWKFDQAQLERVNFWISQSDIFGFKNLESLVELGRFRENVYVHTVLSLDGLFGVILGLLEGDSGESRLGDLGIGDKVGYFVFYVVLLMNKICKMSISQLDAQNAEKIKKICEKICVTIRNLNEPRLFEKFIKILIFNFKASEACIQICLFFIFETVKSLNLKKSRFRFGTTYSTRFSSF